MDSLLDVEEAAAALGTSPRFIRRLIAERRIRFYKIGKHVRIAASDLDAFVAAVAVEPLPVLASLGLRALPGQRQDSAVTR